MRWKPDTTSAVFFKNAQCLRYGDLNELRFWSLLASGAPSVRVNVRACNSSATSLCKTTMPVSFGAVGTWKEIVLNLSALCPLPASQIITGVRFSNTKGTTNDIYMGAMKFTRLAVARAQVDSSSSSRSSSLPHWAIALIVIASVVGGIVIIAFGLSICNWWKKRSDEEKKQEGSQYRLFNEDM